MALITTIEQVRSAGVRVMFINDSSSIADMENAEERFIEPVLGSDLYKDLQDNISADEYADLLNRVRKALAPLAYWLELPSIATVISDSGVNSLESQNMQPVPRWKFEALREELADKGMYHLDKLLQYLWENKEDLEWTPPATYNGIIKTAKEFANIVTLFQPWRTFESLRIIMQQVEDNYIRSTIGDDFFEELRDVQLPEDEENWSDEEKAQAAAIKLIKKCVANLTIKNAVEVLQVKISPAGFTVLLTEANDSPQQGEAAANNQQTGLLYDNVKKVGESALVKLKSYLDTTASDSIFSTYKNSDFYTAPEVKAAAVDPNSTRKIFGF
ncbi:MAG TPA: hypothetical protein PL045_00670 [Chitinophagaceae bacterium]|nr:hypothetical protein [Chitinophagaceae bacterium]